MMFEHNFLGMTAAVRFKKNEYFKKREFSYPCFQSIVYNNVIVTKQIYILTTLLKSWVRISDNIAGAVGGQRYRYREHCTKNDFFH